MSRVQRYDVVVVGGGVMGAAATWHLARAGARVAMIEQHDAGHDRGSSHGRSRIFRLAYRQPHFTALAQRALSAWRRLEDDVGAQLLTTTGGVDHGDEATLQAITASLDAAGARWSRLSPGEATARWPGLRFASDVVHQADAGRVDADAVVAGLHRRASELGAELRFSVGAEALNVADDHVDVVIGDGTLRADVAVVAAGAWLPSFASRLAIALPPMTVTQEQPGYFPADGDASDWPVFVHYADVPRYGLFTPGDGVKVGEHGSGIVVDPDHRPPVDDECTRRLSAYVERWLPGVRATPSRVDSCLYTTTPDEEFVLRREGRIVVCSACSGHGFKFAPVVGERVAAMATSS